MSFIIVTAKAKAVDISTVNEDKVQQFVEILMSCDIDVLWVASGTHSTLTSTGNAAVNRKQYYIGRQDR